MNRHSDDTIHAIIRLLKSMPQWEGVVTSDSMSPLIWKGDRVLWLRVLPESIHRFDIICFYHTPSKIIAHRVRQKKRFQKQWVFTTKGDNANFVDKPVGFQHILGKAVVINPGKNQFILSTIPHELMYFASLVPSWPIRIWLRKLLFTTIGRRVLNPVIKFFILYRSPLGQ